MKLLDTDICVGILKADPSVVSNWQECREPCAISAMTVGELSYGAEKSRNPIVERLKVEQLSDVLTGFRGSVPCPPALPLKFGASRRVRCARAARHARQKMHLNCKLQNRGSVFRRKIRTPNLHFAK